MKALNLITLLISISFLFYAFTIVNKNEPTLVINEINPAILSPIPSLNTTDYDLAKHEIAFYEFALKLMPKKFKWDSFSNTIYFDSIKLHNTDAEYLDKLIKETSMTMDTTGAYTLTDSSSLAKSYFIDSSDITNIMEIIKTNQNVNGIRVYLAYKSGNSGKSFKSHVYIGPSYLDKSNLNENENYYLVDSVNSYLLDLTTPCPSACGGELRPLPNSQ